MALDKSSFFPDGMVGALAKRIEYWYEHPAERATMSGRYAAFAKKYSLSDSLAMAEQMFADAIGERNACASESEGEDAEEEEEEELSLAYGKL